MIHLYYGDGKGKTTAAAGLSLRAVSAGIPVVFAQFLKSRRSGEVDALARLGAVVVRGDNGGRFVRQMTEGEREGARLGCLGVFSRALAAAGEFPVRGGVRVLLVLDEICAAWNWGMLDEDAVGRLLERPDGAEIVLTGRNPPALFLERADYATEFRKLRHPFDLGVRARLGVEF